MKYVEIISLLSLIIFSAPISIQSASQNSSELSFSVYQGILDNSIVEKDLQQIESELYEIILNYFNEYGRSPEYVELTATHPEGNSIELHRAFHQLEIKGNIKIMNRHTVKILK